MTITLIIFFSAIAIQLLYLILFLKAFLKKNDTGGEGPPAPVSIIICAHDELENLKVLVPLLLSQDYPEFEIIIVDDRSNDATFDWLLDETRKNHRVRMVHVNRLPQHVNGKKYGITLGIKAAKHEWLLFTDADCHPHGNDWIKSMSQQFTDKNQFVIGYSPYQKQSGFLNLFIRFESMITGIQYVSFALLGNPYMGVGRNLAYRRSHFLNAKGFNDIIHVTGGDDDLFVNRHATKDNTGVCIGIPSLVYSIPQSTWRTFFRQKVRHLSVGKRYKFGHRLALGLFALTWLMTWFMALPLVFSTSTLYWVISALVLRLIFLTITISVASKKLGQPFGLWAVLPLDFIYAFYYLVTGLVALVSKRIRWKN